MGLIERLEVIWVHVHVVAEQQAKTKWFILCVRHAGKQFRNKDVTETRGHAVCGKVESKKIILRGVYVLSIFHLAALSKAIKKLSSAGVEKFLDTTTR